MIKWKHIWILLAVLAVWQFFLKPKMKANNTPAPVDNNGMGVAKQGLTQPAKPPAKPATPRVAPVNNKAADMNFIGVQDESPIL